MSVKAKSMHFTLSNKVGQLSRITDALKKAKVNILHIGAWSEGGKAFFNLVTNSNAKARGALRKLGARPSESDVLVVNLQHKVGSLDRVAKRLAKAKININCMSATTSGKRAAVLLHTNNNSKAQRLV